MNTMKRRIGACLMALAMIVTMLPGLSITAKAATDYGLVVDYARVTSDRTSGDGWSYNPTTNTLTLNGYSYSKDGWVDGSYSGGIYAQSNLTIELIGNNSVDNTFSNAYCWNCGIYVKGSLTIKGNGSLTTKGGGDRVSYGIKANRLTVNSGTITALGKTARESNGIDISEDIIVNGGVITASAATSTEGDAFGIACRGSFTMNGGRVKATAENTTGPNRYSYGIWAIGTISNNGGVLSAEGKSYALYSGNNVYPEGYNGKDTTFQTYEDAASNMYVVSGVNNNGWSNREVKLTAASGYTIGKTASQFGSSISFTDATDNGSGIFYVKKNSNGTIYKGSISYKIDKTAPSVSGVKDGGVYCVSKEITVKDSHLAEVKDGSTVIATANGTYTLSAGTHNITVTDLAGNSTSMTVTINASHTPNEDDGDCTTAVTCKICGNVVTPAKEHNFILKSDQTGHWKECQNEGCEQTSAKEAHVSSGAATEDQAETCTVCGYTINAPLGHVCKNHLQKVDPVAATCTTEGHKAYYKCTCGKIYSDAEAQNETTESEVTIPANGHSYAESVYTWNEDNLTCTAVRTCKICNDRESEIGTAVTSVTPKDGCKSPEKTVYTVTFANSVFTAQTKEVITQEADAHTSSEWIVDKEATTAEAGSRHKECTVCRKVLETETIAKLASSKDNTKPSGKNDVDKKAADKKADVKPVSNVPKTGDTSHAGVWVMLMTAAVLSGICVILRRRRTR